MRAGTNLNRKDCPMRFRDTASFGSDPEILGGTPVFTGTRALVKTLLEYLEGGDRLDEFLDHFPSVSREQAVAALEFAKEML